MSKEAKCQRLHPNPTSNPSYMFAVSYRSVLLPSPRVVSCSFPELSVVPFQSCQLFLSRVVSCSFPELSVVPFQSCQLFLSRVVNCSFPEMSHVLSQSCHLSLSELSLVSFQSHHLSLPKDINSPVQTRHKVVGSKQQECMHDAP